MKLLLNTGNVDPGSRNDDNKTPLRMAVESEHKDVAKLLLDTEEVDPNFNDSEGNTPLSRASTFRHELLVRLTQEYLARSTI